MKSKRMQNIHFDQETLSLISEEIKKNDKTCS